MASIHDHTKGDWFLINDECVGGPESIEGAGCGIAMCAMRARSPEERQANAMLVAAAPGLLEAIKGIAFARPLGPLPNTKMGRLLEKIERLAVDALSRAEHPLRISDASPLPSEREG